jgi:NADH:ubiquinone reductase (non-electrogenic)
MASSSRALRSFGAGQWVPRTIASSSRALSTSAARQSFAITSTRPSAAAFRTAKTAVRQLRREYSSEAPPKKKAGKIRLTFRWLWRLTYLTAGGTVAYVFYSIYQDRHPPPQFNPDPSKKTLVILGKMAQKNQKKPLIITNIA